MNLKQHYDTLYEEAIMEIQADRYTLDPLIEADEDGRFGITLLIRPPKIVKHEIQKFLERLKGVTPNQYYYPECDMHITVMSVISCYEGFNINQISLPDYVALINDCLTGIKPFSIQLKGITASSSCVMIQGFLETEMLNVFRNELRYRFKSSNLQQSLDVRYVIQTAHVTVVRFKDKLVSKSDFLSQLSDYRAYDFGIFQVNNIELVYNDWYQRKAFVKHLHDFKIV